MAPNATFDPATNLNLYFRRDRNGSKTFSFKNEDDTPYDLGIQEFELIGIDGELTKLANVLTLVVTEDAEILKSATFYEIKNITTGKTWICGTAFFTSEGSAEADDTTDVTIVLDGDPVEITVAAIGGSEILIGETTNAGNVTADLQGAKMAYLTEQSLATGPKTFTLDNEENAVFFSYIRTTNTLAASLDFGALGLFQSGQTALFNNATELYTPQQFGKEKISGTFDGTNWILNFEFIA